MKGRERVASPRCTRTSSGHIKKSIPIGMMKDDLLHLDFATLRYFVEAESKITGNAKEADLRCRLELGDNASMGLRTSAAMTKEETIELRRHPYAA